MKNFQILKLNKSVLSLSLRFVSTSKILTSNRNIAIVIKIFLYFYWIY